MTTAGPLWPPYLGVVLPHEHLLLDLGGGIGHSPGEGLETDADVNAAIAEATAFRQNLVYFPGTRTIVNASSRGLRWDGPNPGPVPGLVAANGFAGAVAQMGAAAGVNVITGTSFYKHAWHPPGTAGRSIEDLEAQIVSDVFDGMDGSSVHAGVIGEVGISWDATDHPTIDTTEQRVVVASALAQRRTGAPINVHFDTEYSVTNSLRADVLAMLLELGVSPDRIIFSHMESNTGDDAFFEQLAASGIYLSFDLFGMIPGGPNGWLEDGSSLRPLIDAGHMTQLLVSQDVWNGAFFASGGYSFIFDQYANLISPFVAENELAQMMIGNAQTALSITYPEIVTGVTEVQQYPFDNSTIDVDTGKAATRTGATSFDPGVDGQALCFDTGAGSAKFDLKNVDTSLPFSVAFWMRADETQTDYTMLVDGSHGIAPLAGRALAPGEIGEALPSLARGWTVQLDPTGAVNFAVGTGDSFQVVKSRSGARDGAWHHVAAVYDGDALSLYLDGVLSGSVPSVGMPVPSKPTVYLGAWGGTSRNLRGCLDDLHVFHGALATTDVLAIVAREKPL
jgi:phosphotriesterase-related protein